MLGGKVRMMLTASAPISPEVLEFLKIAFCCEIYEGYGMTETSGGSFVTLLNDINTGTVGGPLQNCKFKLKDIPDMGYLHSNNPPKGEVCFKGSSIM
jgi:long-chain acyl-CoA synthetase